MPQLPWLDVVAVIMYEHNQVLLAERDVTDELAGLWEFPGGKVEPGESLEGALQREIKEELGAFITIEKHFLTVEHMARKAIRLHVFLAPKPREALTPHVHSRIKWVKIDELAQLPLAPADAEVAKTLLAHWNERSVLS